MQPYMYITSPVKPPLGCHCAIHITLSVMRMVVQECEKYMQGQIELAGIFHAILPSKCDSRTNES